MRVLLDECVNQRLRNYLPGHDCVSAEYAGFDVLLTVDRGLEYEQNLTGRKIAIIIFRTKSIAIKDLLPLVPACRVPHPLRISKGAGFDLGPDFRFYGVSGGSENPHPCKRRKDAAPEIQARATRPSEL